MHSSRSVAEGQPKSSGTGKPPARAQGQTGNRDRVEKVARALLKLGFWAHLIHQNPPGWISFEKSLKKSKKNPIGEGWGAERWAIEDILSTLDRYPRAGLGI